MSYHHIADTNPIRYHRKAISALQKQATAINLGKLRRTKQGTDGRLNVDDKENMLRVTKAQIKTHQECLAFARHYAGEPLILRQ